MEVTTLIRTVGLDLLKPALPQRQLDGHKGTFGKLLIVGGAVGYTGAPYLTASAAVRTGCGLVSKLILCRWISPQKARRRRLSLLAVSVSVQLIFW